MIYLLFNIFFMKIYNQVRNRKNKDKNTLNNN